MWLAESTIENLIPVSPQYMNKTNNWYSLDISPPPLQSSLIGRGIHMKYWIIYMIMMEWKTWRDGENPIVNSETTLKLLPEMY